MPICSSNERRVTHPIKETIEIHGETKQQEYPKKNSSVLSQIPPGVWVLGFVSILLWDRLGASFTFYAGAVFFAIGLFGLAWQPVIRLYKA